MAHDILIVDDERDIDKRDDELDDDASLEPVDVDDDSLLVDEAVVDELPPRLSVL